MSKKVIGALLALALVLSVFSFSVFAAGTGYDNDPTHTQTWGLANKQGSDGTYTVDVLLTTTYEVGPLQFKIDGVDSVTKVVVGSGYYTATAYANASGLVSIIPDTSSTVPVKKLSNAVVATVTYTSSSNANPTINATIKSASNPQGTLMAAYADGNGYLNGSDFLVGQAATIIPLGEEMPEPPAGDADLAVKAGVTGVQINTTYTFGGQYAGVVYGFTVTGTGNEMANTDFITNAVEATDGSALTITPSKGTRYGAGATIKVGDKTYVVVIFGDANGDGRLNAQDATQINKCAKGVATATGALQMGGQTKKVNNATQLAAVNAQDYTEMNKHTKGVAEIDQAGLATALTNTVVEAYK